MAATGTITGSTAYAWGENLGWLNFLADGSNIQVTDTALTGYVWSDNYGWINLGPTNGGVTNNCSGNLGGHAWGENLGWIDFSGASINTSSGKFTGVIGTEGSVVGRISFNCDNCGIYTSWLGCDEDDSSESVASTPTPTPASTSTPASTPTTSIVSLRKIEVTSEDEDLLHKQLFNIKLELPKTLLTKASELSISITFESFGTKPTPVDLTYTIYDSSGNEVWTQKDTIIIETEEVIFKDFTDLDFPDGKYTFVLTTFYNENVQDEFTQDFEVRSSMLTLASCTVNNWPFLLFLFLIPIIILELKKTKQKVAVVILLLAMYLIWGALREFYSLIPCLGNYWLGVLLTVFTSISIRLLFKKHRNDSQSIGDQ